MVDLIGVLLNHVGSLHDPNHGLVKNPKPRNLADNLCSPSYDVLEHARHIDRVRRLEFVPDRQLPLW